MAEWRLHDEPGGIIRLLVVAVAIAGLEVACRAGLIDPITIIPPSAMAAGAWNSSSLVVIPKIFC